MSELRTDYKDDVLDTSQNVNRKFNIVDSNGNILYQDVSLEETTEFVQQGDSHSASVVNEQNRKINEINEHLTALENNSYGAEVTIAVGSTYTTPTNGIVTCFASNDLVRVEINGVTAFGSYGVGGVANNTVYCASTYVPKGVTISHLLGGTVTFRPFVN